MDALRQRIRRIVEKFERPDRMAESKFAKAVSISEEQAHALLDQPDRKLDHERVQQPVDRRSRPHP